MGTHYKQNQWCIPWKEYQEPEKVKTDDSWRHKNCNTSSVLQPQSWHQIPLYSNVFSAASVTHMWVTYRLLCVGHFITHTILISWILWSWLSSIEWPHLVPTPLEEEVFQQAFLSQLPPLPYSEPSFGLELDFRLTGSSSWIYLTTMALWPSEIVRSCCSRKEWMATFCYETVSLYQESCASVSRE